jgi:hypothetical protein
MSAERRIGLTVPPMRRIESTTVPNWQELAYNASGGELIDIVSQGLNTHLRAVARVSLPGIEPRVPHKKASVIDDMPTVAAMTELATRMPLKYIPGNSEDNKRLLEADQVKRMEEVLAAATPHTDLLPRQWLQGFTSLLAETGKAQGEIIPGYSDPLFD